MTRLTLLVFVIAFGVLPAGAGSDIDFSSELAGGMIADPGQAAAFAAEASSATETMMFASFSADAEAAPIRTDTVPVAEISGVIVTRDPAPSEGPPKTQASAPGQRRLTWPGRNTW